MVGQARDGTPDKTGVGRTKEYGTVQREAPGTPHRRSRHPCQPQSACYPQPTRNTPCVRATHGVGQHMWWMAGTTHGAGHLGLTHTETQRGRLWKAWGRRCGDSQNRQTMLATTSITSTRQLLGAADAQTAHPATSSTASAHQPLGSANAETTPARAPATAAGRKQRPDATCEGKNG